MKARIIMAAILAALSLSCSAKQEPFSMQVARSEMARNENGSFIDGLEGKLKWNYTTGLELRAMLDVYEAYGGEDILAYVDQWYDEIIGEDGSIFKYKTGNYSTDHVCPAKTLFRLYDLTGKEKYLKAMQLIRSQIETQPRTSEGGFWHKNIYPSQMWLDGLFMAQPFYAEYASRYEPEAKRDSIYRDVVNNFLIVARHTYDPQTKLYRHAWDESREMFWCDRESGQSEHAWGRALGWYMMAIVDVLDFVPEGTEGRDELVRIFRDLWKVLPDYRDPKSGMWYQVLDRPGAEGNYVEATASAMFSYSLFKGIRTGLLDRQMLPFAKKTYSKLLKEFVSKDSEGLVNLNRCCAVAGLGGKDNRSGNYDYYINEKICANDPKGIGPLIWASLESERLK